MEDLKKFLEETKLRMDAAKEKLVVAKEILINELNDFNKKYETLNTELIKPTFELAVQMINSSNVGHKALILTDEEISRLTGSKLINVNAMRIIISQSNVMELWVTPSAESKKIILNMNNSTNGLISNTGFHVDEISKDVFSNKLLDYYKDCVK